jgi:hypothetical protein
MKACAVWGKVERGVRDAEPELEKLLEQTLPKIAAWVKEAAGQNSFNEYDIAELQPLIRAWPEKYAELLVELYPIQTRFDLQGWVFQRLEDLGKLGNLDLLANFPPDRVRRLARLRRTILESDPNSKEMKSILLGLEFWWPNLTKAERRVLLEGWLVVIRRKDRYDPGTSFAQVLTNEALKLIRVEEAFQILGSWSIPFEDDYFEKLVLEKIRNHPNAVAVHWEAWVMVRQQRKQMARLVSQ